MKKKIIKIVIFLLLFVLGIVYLYYMRPMVDDELYNYGFGYNILKGRIPYLDFNMIIPPIFPYIVSFFMKIFGNYLLVYHGLLVLLIVSITYLAFKKIGYLSIVLYIFMLIYPYTGYNLFGLFLFMILLSISSKNMKYQDMIEAMLISLMFLTKQTLGLLVIPSFIYSKHKKKTVGIYLVSVAVLFLYLYLEKSIWNFFDYCFLGMLDFSSSNGKTSPLLIGEIVIILVLLAFLVKRKEKVYFYILCFQVICFPVVDYYHFVISFIPVVYLLLLKFNNNIFAKLFFISFSLAFFILFSYMMSFSKESRIFLSSYPADGFMKGRYTYSGTADYIYHIKSMLEKYDGYDVYILGNFSYLVKLNLELSINKYDIINNGNMGYLGYQKYIDEIDANCHINKCVFVMNDGEAMGRVPNQSNRDILTYVQNSYFKEYSSSIFSVYSTRYKLYGGM